MKRLLAACVLVVVAGLILYSATGSVNTSPVSPLSHNSTMQAEGSPLPFPGPVTTPESVVLQAEGSPLPFPGPVTAPESLVL